MIPSKQAQNVVENNQAVENQNNEKGQKSKFFCVNVFHGVKSYLGYKCNSIPTPVIYIAAGLAAGVALLAEPVNGVSILFTGKSLYERVVSVVPADQIETKIPDAQVETKIPDEQTFMLERQQDRFTKEQNARDSRLSSSPEQKKEQRNSPTSSETVDSLVPSENHINRFKDLKLKTQELKAVEHSKDELIGGARFPNILPPKFSAVHVYNNDVQKKPVHANYVFDKRFIATQAPMIKHSDGLAVFYTMLAEHTNLKTVVNLTNEADQFLSFGNLKTRYWPEEGEDYTHTNNNRRITVKTNKIEKYEGFDIIKLSMAIQATGDQEETHKELTLFHFHAWPDHSVPKGSDLKQFENFMNVIESQDKSQNSDNCQLVHCKAGVGRTGTFIVLRKLKQLINENKVNKDNLRDEIDNLIIEGRKNRGSNFVQTADQLKMIYEQSLAYLENHS